MRGEETEYFARMCVKPEWISDAILTCHSRERVTTRHQVFTEEFVMGDLDFYEYDNVALCLGDGCNNDAKTTFCRDAQREYENAASDVSATLFVISASLSLYLLR